MWLCRSSTRTLPRRTRVRVPEQVSSVSHFVPSTVIGVNSTHPATRQRFTLAHEIAHLRLHEGQPVFIDRLVRVNWRGGTSAREEIQANTFAAELLMPRRFMSEEIERVVARSPKVAPEELVGALAGTFHVSEEAMRYRLINLGVLGPYSEPREG